jgi:EmrB/QacA subfamily drug resistance transporter
MAASTISLALPAIGVEFHTSLDQTGWVLLSFLVVTTVLMMIAGRVGDLVTHRTVYLLGFAIFGVASLAAGVAPRFWWLLAARVVQGIGGAMIMATGPALLTTSFPASERGKALGILSTATYIGLTGGPPLGGLLISAIGWRVVFWINVPVAVIVLLLGARLLPRTKAAAPTPLDLRGAAGLVTGLPLLLFALSEGHEWGWASPRTLTLAVVGLAALVWFVRYEWRARRPFLDLHLFRSGVFANAVAAAVCNYVALFVPMILLPFFLVEALGVGESHAGLLLSPQPLMMAIIASPAGWLSDRIGSRPLGAAGMLILAIGIGGLATLHAGTTPLAVAAWLAVVGFGTGVFISPNSSTLMGAAPKSQQGVAGGIMAVARNFGMLVGIALATELFRAFGGRAGGAWQATDFYAWRLSLLIAAAVSLLGAGLSFLRGQALADNKL